MEDRLETQENNLRDLLSALDMHSFQISFSVYLSNSPSTQHTLFFKSAALLSYLATQNTVEFNKLVQTLGKDDLDNASVAFVLKAWESLSCYDTDSLRMLYDSCSEDFKGLMGMVLSNHSGSIEVTLRQDIGAAGLDSTVPRDHIQDVKDCIFVVRNFSGN